MVHFYRHVVSISRFFLASTASFHRKASGTRASFERCLASTIKNYWRLGVNADNYFPFCELKQLFILQGPHILAFLIVGEGANNIGVLASQ